MANLRWKKVPNFPKWAGYENGKHVATVTRTITSEPNEWLCWVDGGNGFQKATPTANYIVLGTKGWKLFAEFALDNLKQEIAASVATTSDQEVQG